jgi:putative NADH-flavin reductase
MSRIVVMGGSRGIGLETVKALLRDGHEVVAFSRGAEKLKLNDPALLKISGDATNESDVQMAIVGADIVVQALGVPVNLQLITGPIDLFSSATQTLISVMESTGVRRLIAITGFGAGDSEGAVNCFQKIPFNIIFGHAYRDKSIQEKNIKKSGLDWTILRPGILTNGPLKPGYRVRQHRKEWRNGIIPRAAVADYISRILNDSGTHGTDPVLAN